MNTPQQALELLRNKIIGVERDELTEEQHQQFAEIRHRFVPASPANKSASSRDMIKVGRQVIRPKSRLRVDENR